MRVAGGTRFLPLASRVPASHEKHVDECWLARYLVGAVDRPPPIRRRPRSLHCQHAGSLERNGTDRARVYRRKCDALNIVPAIDCRPKNSMLIGSVVQADSNLTEQRIRRLFELPHHWPNPPPLDQPSPRAWLPLTPGPTHQVIVLPVDSALRSAFQTGRIRKGRSERERRLPLLLRNTNAWPVHHLCRPTPVSSRSGPLRLRYPT